MNNDFLDYIDINLDEDTETVKPAAPKKELDISTLPTVDDLAENFIKDDTETVSKEKPSLKIRIIKELLSYAIIIVAAFILAFLTQHFVIINANIPTGSMIPTITEGDRIIGNRLAYNFSEPARGDVVIFLYPDNEAENYVKRIIGLPGDTVEIIEGIVYINGTELDESAYRATNADGSYVTPAYGNYGPFIVPENCYFMMGDNRNSSWDSRFWDNPYVHKEKILAKAIFCYYPSIHMIK